jgi:CRISPR-associated protein Csd2
MPRIDPETNFGIVTDVCFKRKVRNYVQLTKGDSQSFKIFIREKAVLNQFIEEPYDSSPDVKTAFEGWKKWQKDKKKQQKPEHHYEDLAKLWMCDNYYDIRAFGAVMKTGDMEKGEDGEKESKLKKTAGQVRGPIQLNFGKSIEPIVPLDCSITRMAVTNEKDLEKERTFGRKHIIPYALYRTEGYISPSFATRDLERKIYGTGFSEVDLALFWEALQNMFEHDHSAARGKKSAWN